MTRLLRVISGSDQSPTADFTDDVDWPDSTLAMMAADGQSGVGQIQIYDDGGVIPDGIGQRFLNSHNVITVDDGPFRLFRGRVATKESGRGIRRGRRVRKISITTGDYNTDLRGIVVDNWVRSSESDQTRVNALVTAYLTGSPRATTVIANTYVSSSNAVTLPAKTYTGMFVADVLADIAQTAGKTHFVTVDGQLFFDGAESTAYASALRISDDPADANATTYAPIWEGETAATEDGIEQASHIRSYYGTDTSVTASNGLQVYHDYWEALNWDSLAEAAADAQTRATARLQELAVDTLTITCTIGPIPWAQLGSIKAGHTIAVKARAAQGGRNPAGTFYGDSFTTVRIAELTWKMPTPDTYFAYLRLVRPPKVSPFGSGGQAQVTANRAIALADHTDATFTLGGDIGINTLYELQKEDGVLGAWGVAANFQADSGWDLPHENSGACRASPPESLWYGELAHYTGFSTNVLPANSNFVGIELELDMKSDAHAQGYRGGAPGYESGVKGPHLLSGGFTGATMLVTDIAGGVPMQVLWGNATTKTDIKIYIPSNALPWGSATRFVIVPMFALALNSCCAVPLALAPYPAGDGSAKFGNISLKAKSIATAGWLTGGIVGTQNGINAVYTLVGGWGDVESVSVNGLLMDMNDVDLSGGTPNLTFLGWAPQATDLVLVRYRSL